MPLLDNDEHQKYHQSAPNDLFWGKTSIMKKPSVVMAFQVTRSTIDNEQISFSVPVFEQDSRADIKDRMGFAFSIVQDRLDDANKAWGEAAKRAEEEAELRAKK